MDKKCKICWLLLILFLVLNIVFIGIWVTRTEVSSSVTKKEMSEQRNSKFHGKYKNYLVKELKMDSIQAKKYYKIKRGHTKRMLETIKNIDSLRRILGNEVFSEEMDSAEVAELIEVITTQKMIFEWNNINHLKEVKSILNDEQRIAFDKLHKKMMSKMKHGGGSPFRGESRSRGGER